MSSQEQFSLGPEVDYSFELIEKAKARYDYQKAYVASMDDGLDSDLAHSERELLVALGEKFAALTAVHEGILSLRSPRDSKVRARAASSSPTSGSASAPFLYGL